MCSAFGLKRKVLNLKNRYLYLGAFLSSNLLILERTALHFHKIMQVVLNFQNNNPL